MADYFAHWIEMGKKSPHLPKIFGVNWFRKDRQGNYFWPGFGDNVKVLKWIWDRCDEKIPAIKSEIGYLPRASDLDAPQEILTFDAKEWNKELDSLKEFFSQFQNKLPPSIMLRLNERIPL
jgi:phosphoenolpyruvate carboxykinase (GTP)